MKTLDDWMARFGSDKASVPGKGKPWQHPHDYCRRVYEPLLDPVRGRPVRLLELGWGEWNPVTQSHADPHTGGASARGWHQFFFHPDSTVTVVELEAKDFGDQAEFPRVRLYAGCDATEAGTADLVGRAEGPFDIIVDDASHISSLTIASFKVWWPYLAPGGVYCVEDLHSSYHSHFYGDTEACENPGAHAPTAVAFFKRLADEAFAGSYPDKYRLGYDIASVTFAAPEVVIVRKAE